MHAVPQHSKHGGDVYHVDAERQVADILADWPVQRFPQRRARVELERVHDHKSAGPVPEDMSARLLPPGGMQGVKEAPGEGSPDAKRLAMIGLAEEDDTDGEEDYVTEFADSG